MKIRFRQIDEEDEAKELHALAFPGTVWKSDYDIQDGQHWIAEAQTTVGSANGQQYTSTQVVGFCTAKYRPETNVVRLSRAAVTKSAQGQGLQRRMIRLRCAWGKRMGATRATTYTSKDNWESIANLIKCGFKFYAPKDPAWGAWFHFYKDLT